MSMYYIWNPYIAPDHAEALEFVLTYGQADSLAEGTKEFMEELLTDIGLKANVKSWSLKPYRSKYYSEYLDEDDWRGIWQIVWKVRVVTSKQIVALPKFQQPWIGTNAHDASWSFPKRLRDDDPIGCLVISDFDSETKLKKAQQMIENDDLLQQMGEQHAVGKPVFGRSEVLSQYPQLHVDLGVFPAAFFATGAGYAERAIVLCKEAGGTVHIEERE